MALQKKRSVSDILSAAEKSNRIELGWYTVSNLMFNISTGVVVLLDGKKEFTMSYMVGAGFFGNANEVLYREWTDEVVPESAAAAVFFNFKGALATLTQAEFRKFMKFCADYVIDHRFFNKNDSSCVVDVMKLFASKIPDEKYIIFLRQMEAFGGSVDNQAYFAKAGVGLAAKAAGVP